MKSIDNNFSMSLSFFLNVFQIPFHFKNKCNNVLIIHCCFLYCVFYYKYVVRFSSLKMSREKKWCILFLFLCWFCSAIAVS